MTMATRVLPTSSSGLYHIAMPERICRSVPVPSSRVKRSSLLDFFTVSQALTLTARKSLLQKVSKSTFSVSLSLIHILLEQGRWAAGGGYILASVGLCLAGVLLGRALVWKIL